MNTGSLAGPAPLRLDLEAHPRGPRVGVSGRVDRSHREGVLALAEPRAQRRGAVAEALAIERALEGGAGVVGGEPEADPSLLRLALRPAIDAGLKSDQIGRVRQLA